MMTEPAAMAGSWCLILLGLPGEVTGHTCPCVGPRCPLMTDGPMGLAPWYVLVMNVEHRVGSSGVPSRNGDMLRAGPGEMMT